MVGEVPYGKVPEMLAIADVVLVPFPGNEVSRAASPLKLFEGMAMGKAIVASEVDGIKDVILNQESGVLVKPSDIAAWVEAIADLLNNPSMARRIGGNARRIVKGKYDWKLLAERYEKNFYI
jgi:glycosyltransferase involved in cell wall biosynthesis